MIAVVVSLVAVVLLVLVVVALGMRSMNRRESSLPPERLKQMAEKDERTQTRSTDEFSKSEPRMNNFSPDFSPIGEAKAKPVRTGQRGKRGVDEWGNPHSDVEDEEFWANIRSDAEEGGFGAGGTVAARKGASRPVERPSLRAARGKPARGPPRGPIRRAAAEREREREKQPSAQREQQRPAAKRERPAKREPVAAATPDAATVQAPLPDSVPNVRVPSGPPPPRPASSGLADLVESAQRGPTAAELADQRTVTSRLDAARCDEHPRRGRAAGAADPAPARCRHRFLPRRRRRHVAEHEQPGDHQRLVPGRRQRFIPRGRQRLVPRAPASRHQRFVPRHSDLLQQRRGAGLPPRRRAARAPR